MLYFWQRFLGCRSIAKAEGNRKRVLIVKLDAIGDFIVWLDVAKELRRVYPPNEYEITLMGNRIWTDLAKTLTYFDEVWAIDRPVFFTQTAHYVELLDRLNSFKFDVILHPVYSREFLYGDLFVWASAAKQKIGMQGDCSNLSWWQKRLGDNFYSDLVPYSSRHENELENNAELLRWLGFTDFKAGIPDLKGPYEHPFIQLHSDYYVITAGASVSLRMWPTSRFVALIERVHALTGITAVICGSRAEERLGKTLESESAAPVINLTGQTTLPELVAVISEAHFMVGNETGGVHIAAALGVPSVCIMGGGHFGRFIPYQENDIQKQLPVPVFQEMECFGCNWECIYRIQPGKAAPCVERVSFESVLFAVRALMDTKKCVQA